MVRTFPKSPMYDSYRPTVFGLRDEAAHRARLRRVGHCFSSALLPDLETVMRSEIALLLRVLEEHRGKACDVHLLSRYYALDVTGERVLSFDTFLYLSVRVVIIRYPLVMPSLTLSCYVSCPLSLAEFLSSESMSQCMPNANGTMLSLYSSTGSFL